MSMLKESQHLKIPLKEIEIATKNFQLCIGKGGYGMVFKGELSIHGKLTTVAVKRLNEQFGQGLKEFLMEIQLLTGQKHPNLITLIGYCDEGKEKIIVYEYAENGSLDQYLRNDSTQPTLTWLERLKICVDAARGLNHLHNHAGKHQTIIHRDIKSANILIDHKWVAKISDLGLSKLSLAGLNRSAVISHACGTRGYCEPEYFSSGIVKKESDVYSFGMVLFEVLCGKLCFIADDDGLLLSALLVKDYYKKKKLDEIVDPILREQTSPHMMDQFATIAYKCLHDDRVQRPPMDLVGKELEELLKIHLSTYPLEIPRKISLLLETFYGADVAFYMSDEILQARAKAVIDALDLELEDRAMSFELEKEGTHFFHEMNQEEVKVALNSMKDIGKNRKWVKLDEDYLDANLQTRGLIDSLWTCLRRAQEIILLIHEAVHLFDDENNVDETRYGKVVYYLKKFNAAEDPFTDDFFRIFNFVYKRQITFLEKLQKKKEKLNEKLNQTHMRKWVFSLPKICKNEIKWQKEVISSLQMGNYIAVKDLDKVQSLVNRLLMNIENHRMNADFAIKMEDAMKYVIENIKKQLNLFSKMANDLEEMTILCTANIEREHISFLFYHLAKSLSSICIMLGVSRIRSTFSNDKRPHDVMYAECHGHVLGSLHEGENRCRNYMNSMKED